MKGNNTRHYPTLNPPSSWKNLQGIHGRSKRWRLTKTPRMRPPTATAVSPSRPETRSERSGSTSFTRWGLSGWWKDHLYNPKSRLLQQPSLTLTVSRLHHHLKPQRTRISSRAEMNTSNSPAQNQQQDGKSSMGLKKQRKDEIIGREGRLRRRNARTRAVQMPDPSYVAFRSRERRREKGAGSWCIIFVFSFLQLHIENSGPTCHHALLLLYSKSDRKLEFCLVSTCWKQKKQRYNNGPQFLDLKLIGSTESVYIYGVWIS